MADERIELAMLQLKEIGENNKHPYSWIKAQTPLQRLAEIYIAGSRDPVMNRLRQASHLPASIKLFASAFKDLGRTLTDSDNAFIVPDYQTIIPPLVAGHDPAIYRRACATFAHFLSERPPQEFHQVSQDILLEINRVRRFGGDDLSSALCTAVMVFDQANLVVAGLREPVIGFTQPAHH